MYNFNMGGTSVTCHVILVTVFMFKMAEHEVASLDRHSDTAHSPEYSTRSATNFPYIEIDHDLMPRKIERINDPTPIPVPPGREFALRKYPASKRYIQEIILEINEKNTFRPSRVEESVFWKNETTPKSNMISVLGSSGQVYYDENWGFLSAVLACYNNHWALRTGPEDWWTVVNRRIVKALDDHGEVPQVKDFFMAHKGKKRLEVTVGPTVSHNNYGWLFSQFSNNIREYINIPRYMDIIENDFSSSTDEQTMISQIMFMSSVKTYFKGAVFTLCGIPGVEMKGTEEDWMKLIDKINRLEAFLAPINRYLYLTEWYNTTKTIFNNLLDTYKGNPNIEFWGSIVSWDEKWGTGPRSHWTGWFPEFYGATTDPQQPFMYPSDMVTVPIRIIDFNILSRDVDGTLFAGIVGFTVEEGVRAPVVEPKHAWSLLMRRGSPVADRLIEYYTQRKTD